MKKLKSLLLLFISITIFHSCTSDEILDKNINNKKKFENRYLSDLYESTSFNKMNLSNWFHNTDYKISNKRVHYVINDNKIDVPVINLKIENSNGKIIGIIEALSYVDKNGITDYNILLRDFSKFDFKNWTGEISLIDINSNLRYLNAKVNNMEIIKVNTFIEFPNLGLKRVHPMDTNGDGNVTFSECYAYANSACQSDPDCYTMCYLGGDAIGWVVTGLGPLCQYAISTACISTAWNN